MITEKDRIAEQGIAKVVHKKGKETMADLIRTEAKRFDGFCCSSMPYSCFINEAYAYFVKFLKPEADRLKIDRTANDRTVISIKPLKGSRCRKVQKIMLWK